MCLEPLSEGCSVHLDNGRFREGVRADEFVVGRMVGHVDDADLAAHTFRAPGEVAGVEAEGAVLVVAAPDADDVDSFGADTGVGWLTAFLEGSVHGEKVWLAVVQGEGKELGQEESYLFLR